MAETGYYWVGQDGNVYSQNSDGSASNRGAYIGSNDQGYEAQLASGVGQQIADPYAPTGGGTGGSGGYGGSGGGGGGTSTKGSADDIAFLRDQGAKYGGLLADADTQYNQGKADNENNYNTQLGGANNEKALTYAGYAKQKQGQITGKQSAQSANLGNANRGYNNLAQIIGRHAGRGSSAFKELLPNAVGTDLSTKQRGVADTFGKNIAGIDDSKNQYDISFAGVLQDLQNQKRNNDKALESGWLASKQGIAGLQMTNADALARAQGGGYAESKVAQQPFLDQYNSLKNNVLGLHDKYFTPYKATQAVAKPVNLADYTTDRATINAQAQGGNPGNPYEQMLRRKVQGEA